MNTDLETHLITALRGEDTTAPVTVERAGENLHVTAQRDGRTWQAWHSDLGAGALLLVSVPRAHREHLLSLGSVDALKILQQPLGSADEVWNALTFAARAWPRDLMLTRSLLSLALQEATGAEDTDEGASADLSSIHVSVHTDRVLTVSAWITDQGAVDWEADIDGEWLYLPDTLDNLRAGLRERGFWPPERP